MNGVIEADTVELENPCFAPPDAWSPKCQNIRIQSWTPTPNLVPWVQKTLENSRDLKVLDIKGHGNFVKIGEMIHGATISESLKLSDDTNLTDEDFEKIGAMDLFLCSLKITVEAVKKRLEQFLKNGKTTDEFRMYIPQPSPNFDSKKELFPKNWILKRCKREEEDVGEYFGKIVGGFENVHGIQDPREINTRHFGDTIMIYCAIWKKSNDPCILYPFK